MLNASTKGNFMSSQNNQLIKDAEKQISDILQKLELDTGMVLDSICVNDIDVTLVSDNRQQLQRSIRIDMKRLPGTKWG
jgi:hypothetical protein